MDCSICTTVRYLVAPKIKTICPACYEEAKSLIALTSKLDNSDNGADKSSTNSSSTTVSSPKSSQGFANALKWVKEMKDMEEEMNEKLAFLDSFVTSFRDQTHTDIQVKPGNNGPPIPAHRALLASRSEILKNMLDSDGCKDPPNDNTITVPDLNHEELDSLLEFLYTGTLTKRKGRKARLLPLGCGRQVRNPIPPQVLRAQDA